MNLCAEPDCPCEGWPTLARLYKLRAILGLVVQQGLTPLTEYERLRAVVAVHEVAWKAGETA